MSTSIRLECWAVFACGLLFGTMVFLLVEVMLKGYAGLTFLVTIFAVIAMYMANGVVNDITNEVKELEDGEPRS